MLFVLYPRRLLNAACRSRRSPGGRAPVSRQAIGSPNECVDCTQPLDCDPRNYPDPVMATNLVVRNVEEDVALALKQRAALHGRSAKVNIAKS